MPALTVCLIVALAYLYNYSGMTYTLGAALAGLGRVFPLVSGYLGWVAMLSERERHREQSAFRQSASGRRPADWRKSHTACRYQFFRRRHRKNDFTSEYCGGGYDGRFNRPGRRSPAPSFWHSVLLPLGLSALVFAQAYWLKGMVP